MTNRKKTKAKTRPKTKAKSKTKRQQWGGTGAQPLRRKDDYSDTKAYQLRLEALADHEAQAELPSDVAIDDMMPEDNEPKALVPLADHFDIADYRPKKFNYEIPADLPDEVTEEDKEYPQKMKRYIDGFSDEEKEVFSLAEATLHHQKRGYTYQNWYRRIEQVHLWRRKAYEFSGANTYDSQVYKQELTRSMHFYPAVAALSVAMRQVCLDYTPEAHDWYMEQAEDWRIEHENPSTILKYYRTHKKKQEKEARKASMTAEEAAELEREELEKKAKLRDEKRKRDELKHDADTQTIRDLQRSQAEMEAKFADAAKAKDEAELEATLADPNKIKTALGKTPKDTAEVLLAGLVEHCDNKVLQLIYNMLGKHLKKAGINQIKNTAR